MSKIKDDIKRANYLIKIPSFFRENDDIFDMIYPFTTENINGMFSHFNFKDKDCLSVLGSSDQVFDMYLRGASSVTAFDINPLTEYLFYLKKAALDANLTKEEYLDYFCYRGTDNYAIFGNRLIKPFDIRTFDKIAPNLKGNSYKFWANLYSKHKFLSIREGAKLFTSDEYFRDTLEHTVSYLDDDNFEKLKEVSKNIKITFINKDIKELVLAKNYDLMYFSNIIQYASSMFLKNTICETAYLQRKLPLEAFKNYIMSFKDNLNDNGIIIIGYIYTILDECYSNGIFNKEIRDEVFPLDEFNYYYFKSINYYEDPYTSIDPKREKDACLVYKKTV